LILQFPSAPDGGEETAPDGGEENWLQKIVFGSRVENHFDEISIIANEISYHTERQARS